MLCLMSYLPWATLAYHMHSLFFNSNDSFSKCPNLHICSALSVLLLHNRLINPLETIPLGRSGLGLFHMQL